jgi:uncharacterized protein
VMQRNGFFAIHSKVRLTLWFAVAASVLLCFAQSVWALDVPQLKGRVNDYADMLSPSAVNRLEAVLAELERQDGTQIVVLTIPSLQGDSLEDFSIRTAEKWGIGQKGNDNGALLLIAKNDRKIRIEVGYGLEDRLTDLMSGRIIRNIITPQFKMGHFDQGVFDGVTAMIGTVKGEYTASNPPAGRYPRHGSGSPGLFGLISLLAVIWVVSRVSRPMGAAAGGVLAPIAGLLFFKWSALLILALIPIGALGGFLLGLFGSPLTNSRTGYRSRGGSYWGGGFGGGGFGGGGFGGFSGGGGGFGGGGASGGW